MGHAQGASRQFCPCAVALVSHRARHRGPILLEQKLRVAKAPYLGPISKPVGKMSVNSASKQCHHSSWSEVCTFCFTTQYGQGTKKKNKSMSQKCLRSCAVLCFIIYVYRSFLSLHWLLIYLVYYPSISESYYITIKRKTQGPCTPKTHLEKRLQRGNNDKKKLTAEQRC